MGCTVRVEAGVERDAERVLHHEAARGGGPAARRHQLRARRRRAKCRTSCSSTRDFAGVHFTGSTGVFNSIWQRVGGNLGNYRSYPRIVGETGGKDFVVVHASADPQEVAVGARARRVRISGAEVLGGEPRLRAEVAVAATSRTGCSAMIAEIKMGDVARLPQLHGRGHRREVRSRRSASYLDDAKKNATHHRRRHCRAAKRATSSQPTLVEAKRSGLSADVRGDLRAGRSRPTSTTTTSGRACSRSSIRRRRTR